MARGLLNITAVGNLGRDPELKYTTNGAAVANFSLAVNHGGDGEPTWLRVTAWGGLAEIVSNHLSKGDPVAVAGPAKLSKWTGNDGVERVTLEVTARDLTMLGRPDRDGPQRPQGRQVEFADVPF